MEALVASSSTEHRLLCYCMILYVKPQHFSVLLLFCLGLLVRHKANSLQGSFLDLAARACADAVAAAGKVRTKISKTCFDFQNLSSIFSSSASFASSFKAKRSIARLLALGIRSYYSVFQDATHLGSSRGPRMLQPHVMTSTAAQ